MTTLILIAVSIFIIGYSLITLEHKLRINKSVTAISLGAFLWFLIFIGIGKVDHSELEYLGAEIFGLVVFLMSAMALVEILVHYRFFEVVRVWLYGLKIDDYKQFWLISILTFIFSALLDNLTTTIVMLQIAYRFFKGKNMLVMAAMIVISANAGGAFSPIGDVTTIMLWLAKKFTAYEIIVYGIVPSMSLWLTSTFLMSRKIVGDTNDEVPQAVEKVSLYFSEKLVIVSTLLSFLLPVLAHQMHLPPYLGLMFGLGLVGLIISLFSQRTTATSHLSIDIDNLLKKIDLSSLLFFIGILLAVGALKYLGVLTTISDFVFNEEQGVGGYIIGSVLLGIISAILDNIPLTAAAINILSTTNSIVWVLLALAVGTGGSLLVIGSAAGVVAMGIVKELTFKKYLEIATWPALAGYLVCMLVWYLQYLLFFN